MWRRGEGHWLGLGDPVACRVSVGSYALRGGGHTGHDLGRAKEKSSPSQQKIPGDSCQLATLYLMLEPTVLSVGFSFLWFLVAKR